LLPMERRGGGRLIWSEAGWAPAILTKKRTAWERKGQERSVGQRLKGGGGGIRERKENAGYGAKQVKELPIGNGEMRPKGISFEQRTGRVQGGGIQLWGEQGLSDR